MARMSIGGQGHLSRFGIGAQVALTALLAFAATIGINFLAARPGIRTTIDLTAAKQNQLSTATMGVPERCDHTSSPVRLERP